MRPELHGPEIRLTKVSTGLPMDNLLRLTILATGVFSSARVHAKPKTQAVNLVRDMTHSVREFRHVGHERPIRASTGGPAVVENDIVVA